MTGIRSAKDRLNKHVASLTVSNRGQGDADPLADFISIPSMKNRYVLQPVSRGNLDLFAEEFGARFGSDLSMQPPNPTRIQLLSEVGRRTKPRTGDTNLRRDASVLSNCARKVRESVR